LVEALGESEMLTASGTSKHWCERARQAHAIASRMHDLQAKYSMLEIADRYERKARRAEAKLARITLPPDNDHNTVWAR